MNSKSRSLLNIHSNLYNLLYFFSFLSFVPLEARSGRAVRVVSSARRPVPLRFAYSDGSVAEALQELKTPVYVALGRRVTLKLEI